MKKGFIQQKNSKSTLYCVVFDAAFTKYAVVLLFAVFLLQPLAPVFANEVTETTSESLTEIVNAPEPEEEKVAIEVVPEIEELIVEEVPVTTEEANEDGESEIESVHAEVEDAPQDSVSTAHVVENTEEGENTDDAEVISEGSQESSHSVENNETTTASSTETEVAVSVLQSTSTPKVIEVETVFEIATSTHSVGDAPQNAAGGSEDGTSESENSIDDVELSTTTEASLEEGVDSKEEVAEDNGVVQESSDQLATSTNDVSEISTSEAVTPIDTEEQIFVASTTPATSTEEVAVKLDTVIRNADNFHQFAQTECVEVSEGAYYCAETSAEEAAQVDNALYADRDSDGDYEIFLARDGKVTQVTHNVLDDKAPYYDAHSKTIVWHRLINDRYQIVSYDIETAEEEILTTGTVNNMEPARYGDITVWQRWVKNNWEIMLQNGASTTQLTNNVVHDIAPKISDTHIMWYSTGIDGTKVIKVYEILTGEITTIEDVEGGDIDNVRMVLVFDTVFENGDILTQGYDLESKEVIPLQALPGELPEEIPDSDGTGETRALIQNKSNPVRNDIVVSDDDTLVKTTSTSTVPTNDVVVSSVAVDTGTTTSEFVQSAGTTLDLSGVATSTDGLTHTTEQVSMSSSTDNSHIPDVVIFPQVVATSSDETG